MRAEFQRTVPAGPASHISRVSESLTKATRSQHLPCACRQVYHRATKDVTLRFLIIYPTAHEVLVTHVPKSTYVLPASKNRRQPRPYLCQRPSGDGGFQRPRFKSRGLVHFGCGHVRAERRQRSDDPNLPEWDLRPQVGPLSLSVQRHAGPQFQPRLISTGFFVPGVSERRYRPARQAR